ncbi:hypothetical protein LINPERHAP1_LOCUS39882 [Linum perenne]
MIVNMASSVITSTGRATRGRLIRNNVGYCSKTFTANYGCCLITRAELRVSVMGLDLAWDVGHRRVLLQMDSQGIVSILLHEGEGLHLHAREASKFW